MPEPLSSTHFKRSWQWNSKSSHVLSQSLVLLQVFCAVLDAAALETCDGGGGQLAKATESVELWPEGGSGRVKAVRRGGSKNFSVTKCWRDEWAGFACKSPSSWPLKGRPDNNLRAQ